ncbi:MAG: BTAD domain-containing putative transcriptional regulator [Acidimicrobiales bacterium]
MVEYRVLGPLSVTRNGEAVDLSRPLERRLLAVLLTNRARTLLDDQIVDALWPDRLPGSPGQSLRTSVSRLRKRLGGRDVIVRDKGGYRLVVEPGSVDADRFEALVASVDPGNLVARLGQALDLWSADEAYADFRYDDFVQPEAERLQALRLQAYEDLFAGRLDLGESHELISELQALVGEHPHREPLYRLLMLALYRAGQQRAALRTFRVASARLGSELGIEPSRALIELEQQILLEDPQLALTEPATPNNIPSRIASIVGRKADIDQVCTHLEDQRLVTVMGPVGVGKSTAAIESARQIVAEGRRESWYIDLGGVTADDQLSTKITDKLAKLLHRSPDRDWQAFAPGQLIGTKKMLIVLDNCEHVIDGIGDVAATILKDCPNASILASSRERLGLPGELVYPLAPLLAGAEGDDVLDPRYAVDSYPALRLFAERAQSASPGFQLSPADVPTALRLCRKLDCLPLAIELAAARVPSFTIAEIEQQLEGRYSILSSQRGVEERHRSIEAAIAWSYDLLDEHEQECLQLLARVSGPFTITDATNLFDSDDESRVAVAVASLRDKSLVRTYGEISQRRRFTMLRTIRQFATTRATEAGKNHEHRMRHAFCFLSLAREADKYLLGGPHQLQWLKRCDENTTDLLQAVQTFIDEDHVEEALDLVARVGIVWTRFRHNIAAYPAIRDALTASGADVFASTPRVHLIASWISVNSTEREVGDGSAHAQHALRTAQLVGDGETAIVATALRGLNEWLAGQGDDARGSVAAACNLAAGEDASWAENFAFLVAGIVEHALRPADTTTRHLERAAELATARSDEWSRAVASGFLGSALKDAGQYSRASVAFRQAYESGRRIGDPDPAIVGAAGLALVSGLDRDHVSAEIAADRALKLLEPLTGATQHASLSQLYLGYQTSFDIAEASQALTRIFLQPRGERAATFIRFLLDVAERRAVDLLDADRVGEIRSGLTTLDIALRHPPIEREQSARSS